MNNLSWMLYWIEVIQNFQVFSVVILVLVGVFTAMALLIAFVSGGDAIEGLPKFWKYWILSLCVTVFFGFLTVFIPSKNTMYAIAISEYGQKIAQSEEVSGIASDAAKALRQWIKSQLEDEGKKR